MRRSVRDLLLSAWWVSWVGIIAGFLYVGVSEIKSEFSRGAVSRLSLTLLVTVSLLWLCFFTVDSKTDERTPALIKPLTAAGTALAAITLLGIWFYAVKAG
jgi:hypothetical protein